MRKPFVVLFITLLLDMIGTGMVIPIIPVIFTDPTSPSFLLEGYSESASFIIAGLVTSLFGLMQFIAAPILGELSDVYGRKKILTIGVGTLAFSQLIFGFGIETASVALLLISRAIAGIAGANFSVAQASIADMSTPENRAKNFGMIGAAFGIGFILGPLLGGWISSATGNPATPFWFAGILGIINLISLSLFFTETNKYRKSDYRFNWLKGLHNIKAAFLDKDIRPIYMAQFAYLAGFAFFVSFIGIFLVNKFSFTEGDVGTFFGIVGACVVISQLFILRILASKYKERQILRYSILIVGTTMFAYPFAPNGHIAYLLIPFFALAQGLGMANLNSLVSRSVPHEKQGAALGISGSLMAFSQGVAPVTAGLFTGALGLSAPFIVGGVLIYLSWSFLFVFNKKLG